MKYIKILIIIGLLFALATWATNAYLVVDDLKSCNTKPELTTDANSQCAPADAIVAISGGDTAARADEAIDLYKNGWSSIIIFSGAAKDKSGPSNALVMKQRAIDAGVAPGSIIIEENSETTEQNALETKTILDNYQIKSVIVVTSPYHLRRASLEFQKKATGVDVRSHSSKTDKQWSQWWWLTPSGWILAIPEVVVSLILSTGGVVR